MAGPGEASRSAVGRAGKLYRARTVITASKALFTFRPPEGIGSPPVRADRRSAGGLVTRRYGVADTYEQLKEVTRQSLQAFIKGLAIPEPEKKGPVALMPSSYIGKAAALGKRI